MNVQDIPLAQIKEPRLQPRLQVQDEGIPELAHSISEHGLISPLTVTLDEGGYRLLAGNRRLMAIKRLGWAEVPCIIVDADLDLGDQITIAENIIRRNLSPVEEAYAFAIYLQRTGETHEQLADRLGKERTYVTRRLLLTDLDDTTLAAIEEGIINLTQALQLRRVEDPDVREMFIEHAQRYGCNVRVMEVWVNNYQREQARARAQHERDVTPQEVEPPRQVFMACDRCGEATAYESLRPAYLCPNCKLIVATYRAQKAAEK